MPISFETPDCGVAVLFSSPMLPKGDYSCLSRVSLIDLDEWERKVAWLRKR